MPEEGLTAMLCSHYAGRLPSEIEAEPLTPMLREVEARHALTAWATLRQAGRDGTKYDELKKAGIPLLDEMQQVRPEVLRRIKDQRAQKAAAEAAREAEKAGEE